ncbi:hypothetical protein ACFYMO_11005 [Streptomyces sp. NPDC007025]
MTLLRRVARYAGPLYATTVVASCAAAVALALAGKPAPMSPPPR